MPRIAAAPRPAKSTSLYSVHPAVVMVQEWIHTLPEKSGRSLDQWIALVKRSGPKGTSERRDWLKKDYQLGINAASWIAARAEGGGGEEGDPDEYLAAAPRYVAEMYSGSKAGLRPIHDALIDLGRGLGGDVRVCPCKTIVPLYRHHVFAQIKPSTRTRIDFGLALGATRGKGRLIETGGYAKKDRITHRFGIESIDDIDAEVRRWTEKAYRADE
jgi:hypothetical protein